MRIRIGQHEFEGPYVSSERLNDWPGVYAIISITNGAMTVIDVAATDRVKRHVQRPEKVDEWREIARGRGIGVAVIYTHGMPAEYRQSIESDVRSRVDVICEANSRDISEATPIGLLSPGESPEDLVASTAAISRLQTGRRISPA